MPPKDLSALFRAIDDLQAQIAEIKEQISVLTKNPFKGYYQNTQIQSQEQTEKPMREPEAQIQYYEKNKNEPPYIPHITLLQCVRCAYQWTPRTRRPKKCPKCKAPWWYPPKWRWHDSSLRQDDG